MMPASTPPRGAARPVDARALGRVRRRLQQATAAPWLHTEVARRMAERLPLVRLKPQRVLDWGARIGGGHAAVQAVYPKARITAVEELELPVPAGDIGPAAWWTRLFRAGAEAPPLDVADVPDGQAQLVWSNMTLHGAADPQASMRQWQRALQVDGFLMFSTLGPGTLQDLAAVYRRHAWPVPHAPFVDMHDLGDMLIEAGFADPVMDQETLTLTWADVPSLLTELRSLGGNVDPRRHGGLRTPGWHGQMSAALEGQLLRDGRLALTFEIVYGHAFRAAPRHALQAETMLPLADMRAMMRAGRGGT